MLVNGPTRWSSAEVVCPPALRPAVCILLAMLAAKGTSVLRNVDIIARGYEHLYERLVEMGAAASRSSATETILVGRADQDLVDRDVVRLGDQATVGRADGRAGRARGPAGARGRTSSTATTTA